MLVELDRAQWDFLVPRREFYLVAAPMTGLPELNLPNIRHVISTLRATGYVAFNPFAIYEAAELDKLDPDFFTTQYMPLATHPRCVGVIALPGWMNSHGATTEVVTAERFHKPQFVYRVLVDLHDGGMYPHLQALKREAICV